MLTHFQRIELLFSFSLFLLLARPCYSQTQKSLQGWLLRDGDELVSAYGYFRMGFFSPLRSKNRYVGIWYHRNNDPLAMESVYDSMAINQPVWVANRNTPILDKSASLTIDSIDGNLKILHYGGNSIAVSSVKAKGNTSATLQADGNFVLNELNSDGSVRRKLWQSFDYPTDTLFPGMKLGINLQTGHRWFLQSWIIPEESPAQGSYTLGIDPNISNQMIVWRWRGEVYLTSGITQNGTFDSFGLGSHVYYFCYTSNEHEKYFTYSANYSATSFPMLRVTSYGLTDGIYYFQGSDLVVFEGVTSDAGQNTFSL